MAGTTPSTGTNLITHAVYPFLIPELRIWTLRMTGERWGMSLGICFLYSLKPIC